MSAILLAAPAAEPLSVAEAKSFLRVEHDDDDVLIGALIAAARHQIEALTRRSLLTQTWRLVLDRWPNDGRIAPRLAPLRAVTAARIYDAANNASAIDTEQFVIDAAAGVIAAPKWSLPAPGRDVAGIELDVTVGFGDNAADVPEVLRHALRTLVAHWYEHRGLAAIGSNVAMLPGSVSAMIASYRMLSL
ncbi:MAG TPA: head-tail connector protein [Pseudolabrys sp.]